MCQFWWRCSYAGNQQAKEACQYGYKALYLAQGKGRMNRLILIVAVLFIMAPLSRANTIIAATCSQADVQNAINGAVEGDTVKTPGPCSFSWTGLSFSKAVTLDGGGNSTLNGGASSTAAVTISSTATGNSRFTGFTITAGGNANQGVLLANGANRLPWRIDHNTFTGGNTQIVLNGGGISAGLIDHNTVTLASGQEFIHDFGRGSVNPAGWTSDVIPANPNFPYIEDNTVTVQGNPPAAVASFFQGYYGSVDVIRHNNFGAMVLIDVHGTAPGCTTNPNIGGRWWEISDNVWNLQIVANQYAYIAPRAGSGVIYNNSVVNPGNNSSNSGTIKMIEDCTASYPQQYQIGRGVNQDYSPAYVWNNLPASGPGGMGVVAQGAVTQGTDYFVSTLQPTSLVKCEAAADGGSPGGAAGSCPTTFIYTPYTYPHPLQSASSPAVSIAPSPIAFGNQQLGITSTPLTVTVTNSGSATLTLANPFFTITGTNAADFARTGGTCTSSGTVLAAGNCTVILTFTPATTAAETATLNINGNANGSAIITGTGTSAPTLTANRVIDWTHVGIPGGIPSANWPIAATLTPSGTADDSVAIQAAINAAAPQSVVFLGTGTFKLHRGSVVCSTFADDFATGFAEAGLCINKNIALRGAGPDKTIIQYGDGANIISLGQLYLSSSNVVFIPITAGSTKGSTSITLGNTTNVTVNSYIVISQTNPTDSDGNPLVNTSGYTGSCSSCGHSLPNQVMEQIDKVTAVNGNVVTLERPLYFDYLTSPVAYHLPMTEGAGLENLRLTATAASGTLLQFKNINMMACAHCWVHDVESDLAVDKSDMYMSDVYGSEISDNYFNDGFSHSSGASYEVMAEFRVSETLIQNNIIRKARHSMIMNGTSGNVWAYNYAIDSFMSDFPNSLAGDNGHGAHPYMNLFEGNIDSNIEWDFAHGSSSHNTVFRNYLNLTSTNPNTGNPMTGALFAMNTAYYNNYENILGNAIGQWPSGCTASVYQIKSNASQSASIFKIGYFDDGGTPTPNQALTDKVENTMLRGGNWDCVTNTTVWSNNVPSGSFVASYLATQTLPSSYYLSAKPSWFTAINAVYPPVDPASATIVNKIPAQRCYEAGPAVALPFKPTTCYAAVTGPFGVASPTTLSFGNQATGSSSASQLVTLTNTGSTAMATIAISITGANPTDFSEIDNCGTSLGPGLACSINVTFSPTFNGSRAAQLNIASNATNSPTTVALSGIGIGSALITFSISNVNFFNQFLSTTTSVPIVVVMNNLGTAAMNISSITLTGTNAADFALAHNCGAVLGVGLGCNLNLTFTPSVLGARSATLTVNGDDPGSPHVIPVSGTGVKVISGQGSMIGTGVVKVSP
jgi:hypothetical protein